MKKREIAKRVFSKIKDKGAIKELAIMGLEYAYTNEQLWYFYDNGFKFSDDKEIFKK